MVGGYEIFLEDVGTGTLGFFHPDTFDKCPLGGLVAAEGCNRFLCHML